MRSQPYVPPDGGKSRIVRGLCHHPDDCLEAHLDDDAMFYDPDAAEEEERDEAHSCSVRLHARFAKVSVDLVRAVPCCAMSTSTSSLAEVREWGADYRVSWVA